MVLEWCDPPPVAAFVVIKLQMSVVEEIAQVGIESAAVFGSKCMDVVPLMRSGMTVGVPGNRNEPQQTQQYFWEYQNKLPFVGELFFGGLCGFADA
jgi:hypothetical protein